jgi:hypothetical protein
MSDEKRDESLGVEHLPQSELEASPKTGKQLDAPAQTPDKATDNQAEAGKQFITRDDVQDEIPL